MQRANRPTCIAVKRIDATARWRDRVPTRPRPFRASSKSGNPQRSPDMDLTEDELKPLYMWIDQIPLSRPKRNIARDFSDGGMRSVCPGLPELLGSTTSSLTPV